jgi:WD40 repeat protein
MGAMPIDESMTRLVRALPSLKNTVSDIGWKPQTKAGEPEVLASSGYGGVNLWRADLDVRANLFSWRGSSLTLAWSPDARYIATGDQDCTVHFWIVAKSKDLEMSGYPIKVQELAWSADSRFLATGGSVDVTVWNCSGRGPRGTEPIGCEGHEEKITALAFSRGGILASAASDGELRMWLPHIDATSRATFIAPDAVSIMAWSPDDALLAIGTAEGAILCCAPEIA